MFPCCTWSVGRGSACLVVAWICKHERHEAMERSLIWRSGHVGSLPALRSVSQGNASILLGLRFFIWTREVLRPTSQSCQKDQMRWCVSCCQQTELLKSFSAAEGGGVGGAASFQPPDTVMLSTHAHKGNVRVGTNRHFFEQGRRASLGIHPGSLGPVQWWWSLWGSGAQLPGCESQFSHLPAL